MMTVTDNTFQAQLNAFKKSYNERVHGVCGEYDNSLKTVQALTLDGRSQKVRDHARQSRIMQANLLKTMLAEHIEMHASVMTEFRTGVLGEILGLASVAPEARLHFYTTECQQLKLCPTSIFPMEAFDLLEAHVLASQRKKQSIQGDRTQRRISTGQKQQSATESASRGAALPCPAWQTLPAPDTEPEPFDSHYDLTDDGPDDPRVTGFEAALSLPSGTLFPQSQTQLESQLPGEEAIDTQRYDDQGDSQASIPAGQKRRVPF